MTDKILDWIRSNSIDVHADVGSTRILGAALKQAIESEPMIANSANSSNSGKRSRDEEIHEPKKVLKIVDRLGPSVTQRLGLKVQNGSKNEQEKISTRQKCSFWPNCKR